MDEPQDSELEFNSLVINNVYALDVGTRLKPAKLIEVKTIQYRNLDDDLVAERKAIFEWVNNSGQIIRAAVRTMHLIYEYAEQDQARLEFMESKLGIIHTHSK